MQEYDYKVEILVSISASSKVEGRLTRRAFRVTREFIATLVSIRLPSLIQDAY